MDKNNYCVIMAGGVGSRFWPVSRTANPKQFIDILGVGRTLLQMTFDRFVKIIPKENIYVVTNEIYSDVVLEQLPELSKEQVLGEPMRRNTAPCIAYANFKILKKNPEARIVVAPSDHLIVNENEFLRVVGEGLNFVKSDNILLTLGIEPSRPDTGYGYIQINKDIKVNSENTSLHKVKTFTEKPDLELAKVFLESGEFFWNSGIFIWSLKSIFKAFETYLPDVNNLFTEGLDLLNTDKEQKFISDTYANCKSISIDYGVMEKADNVFVYCADFGWSDLGTWGSLYEHSEKDENGNATNVDKHQLYDTSDCIIQSRNGKLVVTQGLEDYIIVDTRDVLLICKKQEEQQIRKIVNDVNLNYGDEFV